jgi:Dolichyl-phosphate-mannose-protein mannosyltransferase
VREATRRLSPRTLEAAFVAAVLTGFVLFVSPTLGQPLLERHAFRQTQTAYTARIFHEQGIDLLHPKLPVLGDPFEVPFEFPLFQAAASIVMDAGVRDDVAMRATGLACFLLTALLLYGLVRRIDGRVSGLAALVAFVATQFAVLWSRTSMIEYLATAGAVGFAWATIAWRESRRPSVGALALAAGLVGMLVKPTTTAFWVLPALGYRTTTVSPGRGRRGALWLAALALVPLVAALLWTRHADSIKAASPTTAGLTSDSLGDWNFGSLSQRFERDAWEGLGERLLDYILGPAGIVLLAVAVVGVVKSSQRGFWLGIALTVLLPPLVFMNLYLVHDYYLAALTPGIAAMTGLAVGFAWRTLARRAFVIALTAVVLLHLATSAHELKRSYWAQGFADSPAPGTLALAREVHSQTGERERVGVVGLDWSPSVLYYANRWGLMVVETNREAAYDTLRADGYRYLLVADPDTADLTPLSRWSWIGSLGPNGYAIADRPGELGRSPVAATDELDAMRPAGALLRSGVRLDCGRSTPLPTGQRGTLMRVREPSPRARLRLSDDIAPVPARRAIFVRPTGPLSVSCAGRLSLVVDVFDAAFPARS